MPNYKLTIEFDNIADLQEFTKLLYEMEVLKKKAILKQDEAALGYNSTYSIEDSETKTDLKKEIK